MIVLKTFLYSERSVIVYCVHLANINHAKELYTSFPGECVHYTCNREHTASVLNIRQSLFLRFVKSWVCCYWLMIPLRFQEKNSISWPSGGLVNARQGKTFAIFQTGRYTFTQCTKRLKWWENSHFTPARIIFTYSKQIRIKFA